MEVIYGVNLARAIRQISSGRLPLCMSKFNRSSECSQAAPCLLKPIKEDRRNVTEPSFTIAFSIHVSCLTREMRCLPVAIISA